MGNLTYKNLGLDKVNKALLSVLSKKNRDIMERRFGLFGRKQRQTLEEIGGIYGITRERVRQIEEASLKKIKKSSAFAENQKTVFAVKSEIEKTGGIVEEEKFLNDFSPNKSDRNHLVFLLRLIDEASYSRADNKFKGYFTINPQFSEKIKEVLIGFGGELQKENEVLGEKEIAEKFGNFVKGKIAFLISKNVLISWLGLANFIGKNQFGEWGPSSSIHISPRGSRDFAYLILKKENKPLHFREIAEKIERHFSRKAHFQTVHNELIKHPNFVLVGRGMYALKDWGYKIGTVKEIIAGILKEKGPLPKEKIIDEVLKERFVKQDTILVNLQNKERFKKQDDHYHLV